MRRLLVITLALIFLFAGFTIYADKNNAVGAVKAFGPLNVTFSSIPLFEANNFYPGEVLTTSFTVENTDTKKHDVYIKANILEDSILSGVINIKISQGANILYGSEELPGRKSLAQFYKEASVKLGNLNPGEIADYLITLTMAETAGDDYQNKSTSFDLLVGIDVAGLVNIPPIAPHPTLKPFPTIPKLPKLPPINFHFLQTLR